MGAQLLGGNSYGSYANMAAQHGGAGNRTLFNQQTAPDQYQQGLDQQGMAINGIGGLLQALAYMHMMKQGQPGQAMNFAPVSSRAEDIGLINNPFHRRQAPVQANNQVPRIMQQIQNRPNIDQYPRPYPQQQGGSAPFNFLPMFFPG